MFKFWNNTEYSNVNHQKSAAYNVITRNDKNEANLYTPDVLFNIYMDIVSLSSSCSSKQEQIQMLLKIYNKYEWK